MNDAWMVRSSERQTLIAKLKQEIMEMEEEHGRKKFDYELAHVLLHFLQDETKETPLVETVGKVYFKRMALPEILKFARAKEERDGLICDLLRWITESITFHFYFELTHKEMTAPTMIFHADSATAQI